MITSLPLDLQLLILLLVKVLFIIGAFLYLIFSFVVVRQIYLMRSTLVTPFSNVIIWLGFGHLILAFSVLFSFIILL